MKFLDLPTELVHYIVKFLPAESLSRLSQTCKQLNEVADSDSLWQGLSYREYKIGSNKGWNISYKVMYTKILRPWHKFLGLKRIELVPYGGLVNVCWAEGEIQVIRYHSKPGDMAFSKLSRVPLFSLRWNETVPCIEVVCVQCSYERPAVLSQMCMFSLVQCDVRNCYKDHKMKVSGTSEQIIFKVRRSGEQRVSLKP
uniref:F-box domain-containing protein n=1 Tax=Arion vulgaris TaxID=1028688 RepID=A0A0B7B3G0_9EUPU